MAPIPITIVTGFLGSGKTTLILNLIPQLPKHYKLALLKNEFGDVAIDSQLASSAAISGVQELLNGCICCNLVGQLGDALEALRNDVSPDRIVIETSGSAFPATLAMEVNRLGRESGHYVLDGVIVVIDVENWKGYEDTSYTAKLQARYTDLIVFNKWEQVNERKYEDCLDRVGDLELPIAHVKSNKGHVDQSVLLGLDSSLAKNVTSLAVPHHHDEHGNDHTSDHHREVEVLSVSLSSEDPEPQGINLENLDKFLVSAPKDEIYRIKAIFKAASHPTSPSDGSVEAAVPREDDPLAEYILNWAFGRWTFTPLNTGSVNIEVGDRPLSSNSSTAERNILSMTVILARGEAERWKVRIESEGLIRQDEPSKKGKLKVKRKI
ncbi:hypothetical protein MMC07_004020 [Pseudocyphellaria aurata]|nr:hypothetical protein [Pseudocyphellaria aurata]